MIIDSAGHNREMTRNAFDRFPRAQPPLPLPPGMDADAVFAFLNSVRVEYAPEADMAGYCRRDWRRFLHTWSLLKDVDGNCLELGANPYFTTCLLREYTPLTLHLANFFGSENGTSGTQRVKLNSDKSKDPVWIPMKFEEFNVESGKFPYQDASFDCVLFCEILEHLQTDPMLVLREIKRVLKPNGILVLTTPNVAKLQNRLRLLIGKNINDRYSGFGPYGRHNREYTVEEVQQLLAVCGFDCEVSFTADVHFKNPLEGRLVGAIRNFMAWIRWSKSDDLGQYVFVRSRNARAVQHLRPNWLFRNFSD